MVALYLLLVHLEFQFLIGKIKTKKKLKLNFLESILFQFLIGKIKTEMSQEGVSIAIKFQFLIGKIKTDEYLNLYCKGLVFQFLIGKIKTQKKEVIKTILLSFNSL